MSAARIQELRQILRAHRREPLDLATPIREAVDRQDAVLRANQEPQDHEALEAERAVNDGLDRLFRRLGPPPTTEK